MTLDLTSDLEPLLEAEAEKSGSSPSVVAEEILLRSLKRSEAGGAPHLSAEETVLLEEINQGPSSEEMESYIDLIGRRQSGSISDEDLDLLKQFTHRMEKLAVSRFKSLAKLAKLREMDIDDLMKELQIDPPNVL